ncbi:AbrB/MazE/SpoVT family DNA-binding domain-containing protein [Candidatus Bathyarchaeota archaeon]|nr:AbrB/MazE/SpoVT family DNA-binding domain-containing protein [Candidatus Bathyarchaeota archaeon]MBS7618241.1 AbrB/MazE/SpoVT family DNA-binding domain-containing protein [Candidatus Bathyarchaeota archaeon]
MTLVELRKMVEGVVKKVDPQGRISIPIEWRRGWKSDRVFLKKCGDVIEVIPIEPLPPSNLFDSIKIGDEVDFTDPHSLKRAFMESRRR